MWSIIRRLVGVTALVAATAVPVVAPSPQAVSATAPTPGACNANTQFCGVGLHVKNGSATVITSKAIGAHYGALWAIPTGPNNSTGTAFCIADAFTGAPTGPISEQPLPALWTQAGLRQAGYILAMFAGDRVSPYQPIAIDAAGEVAGYTTRERFVATHLALLSVLPNYVGGGSYLPLVDPGTMQLFADAAGTTPSSFQAVAPLVQQIVDAASAHHAGGSDIVLTAAETSPGVVTVTATKDGMPVADLPIWPTSTVGVTYTGTTAPTAFANAAATGWPSLDYSTIRAGAGITDVAGQATFAVTAAVLAAGVEFNTEEAPGIVHMIGDGQSSQDNLTWSAGEIRPYSARYTGSVVFELQSQVSDASPLAGETLRDSVIVRDLSDGVTLTVQVEAFDLTVDPAGTGTPLVSVQVPGLGSGTHPGLAPYTTTMAQGGHTIGYRHRAVAASDGSLLAPSAWSTLGIPSETAIVRVLGAETHLRKTVAGDGTTWINAQKGTTPAYSPAGAPTDPRVGSHDDGAADAGDAVPVYAAGTKISFGYEVWLDPTSTGVVTWPSGTTGLVTDDNGTPSETADDFQPLYVSGDDGDTVLELGETWLYLALETRTAAAGEMYSNYSALPGGDIHTVDAPTGLSVGTTTPRTDPAGYVVPECSTVAINQSDQTHLVGVRGGTVVDTVACTNLVPGVTVTVSGEPQLRQPDGSGTPTGITASTTFTPAAPTASVDVVFTIPASASPGLYVFFETLIEPVSGLTLAVHADINDANQTIRKRSPISVATRACHGDVVAPSALQLGAQCDVITVGGDGAVDGFAADVVTGTITGYPVIDGVRQCSRPGPTIPWSATINESGIVVVTTAKATFARGDWEFIESAETPDGRTWSRDCLTAPPNAAESFTMSPAKRVVGGGIPLTGSDSQDMVQLGAGLVGLGALASLLSSRRHRRAVLHWEP